MSLIAVYEWLASSLEPTRYLVLLLPLLFVYGVLFFDVGGGMGVRWLFFHERHTQRQRAGFAVGALTQEVMLVAALLFLGPRIQDELPSADLGLILLAPSLGWLPIVTLAIWLPRAGAVPGLPDLRSFWSGVALGAWLFVVLCAVPFLLLWWLLPEEGAWGMSRRALQLHTMALVGLSAFLVHYLRRWLSFRPADPNDIDRNTMTPAAGGCSLMGLTVAAYGASFYWMGALGPLAFLGYLALFLYTGREPYRLSLGPLQQVPSADGPKNLYLAPVAALPPPRGRTPEHALDLAAPLAAAPRGPLVVVAVSGGGLRAALWVSAVLIELEKKLRGFPYRVRLITGASGGMLGASYYVRTLLAPEARPGQAGRYDPRRPETEYHHPPSGPLLSAVAKDGLTATINTLLFRDLPRRLWNLDNPNNRGQALEDTWEQFLHAAGAAPVRCFQDLYAGEEAGWRPSLLFSPVLVEDGRRLLISNLWTEPLCVNHAPDTARSLRSRAGFDLAQLFGHEARQTLPVFTAARLSATFPYITPEITLPTLPPMRVVDAGYVDNYGVNLACRWLSELRADPARRAIFEEKVTGVLLLQLRDDIHALSGEPRRLGVPAWETGRRRRRRPRWQPKAASAVEGVFGPPQALFSTHQALQLFRNDEQLAELGRSLDTEQQPGFFRTEVIEMSARASLSWYLTTAEKRRIRRAAGEEVERLAPQLRAWWEAAWARSARPDV